MNGNVEMVQILLKAGADTTIKSPNDYPFEGFQNKTAVEMAQERLRQIKGKRGLLHVNKRKDLIEVIRILKTYKN